MSTRVLVLQLKVVVVICCGQWVRMVVRMCSEDSGGRVSLVQRGFRAREVLVMRTFPPPGTISLGFLCRLANIANVAMLRIFAM